MENKKHTLNQTFLNILRNSLILFVIAATPLFAEKKLVVFTNDTREVIDVKSEPNGNISGTKSNGEKVFYKKEDIKSVTTYFDYYDIFRRAIILQEKKYVKGIVVSQTLKNIAVEDEKTKKILNFPGEQIKDVENYRSFESELSKTRRGALWRSAVLPGWGQAYSGHKWKSYLIGFLTAAGVVYTAENYIQANHLYPNYVNSLFPQESLYSKYWNALHRATNGLIFLGVIYTINLFDAYFSFTNTYQGYQEWNMVVPSKEAKQEIKATKKF